MPVDTAALAARIAAILASGWPVDLALAAAILLAPAIAVGRPLWRWQRDHRTSDGIDAPIRLAYLLAMWTVALHWPENTPEHGEPTARMPQLLLWGALAVTAGWWVHWHATSHTRVTPRLQAEGRARRAAELAERRRQLGYETRWRIEGVAQGRLQIYAPAPGGGHVARGRPFRVGARASDIAARMFDVAADAFAASATADRGVELRLEGLGDTEHLQPHQRTPAQLHKHQLDDMRSADERVALGIDRTQHSGYHHHASLIGSIQRWQQQQGLIDVDCAP